METFTDYNPPPREQPKWEVDMKSRSGSDIAPGRKIVVPQLPPPYNEGVPKEEVKVSVPDSAASPNYRIVFLENSDSPKNPASRESSSEKPVNYQAVLANDSITRFAVAGVSLVALYAIVRALKLA
jgi:hypothetical protein